MYKTNIVFIVRWFLILFSIQFGIAYYFIVNRYDHQKDIYEDHLLVSSSMEFELLKKAYDTLADATFELSINTPLTKEMISKANESNVLEKAKLRQQVYRENYHLYQALGKYNLSQLQFHLPGSISFLRFQHPEKFGDSLRNIRPSIDAVNLNGIAVKGFEIGRFVNAFRHVYPLFYDKKLVGTVELAYSFEALKEMAEKLYPAQYDMILKTSAVNSKIFEEEREHYITSPFSKEYVKELHYDRTNQLLDPYLIQQLDKKVANQIGNSLGKSKPYLYSVKFEEKSYVVIFIPLYNFDRKLTGYVIRYEHSSQLEAFESDKKLIIMMAAITAALISLFLIFFVSRMKYRSN